MCGTADLHHSSPDVAGQGLGARPVLGVADRHRLDGVGDEVGERLDGRLGRQQLVRPGAPLVEHLPGPPANRLCAEGEVAMKRLKKQGELTPYVGDDLVRVGGHQAARVHEHAVELRRVTEAIPIGLLHLPGFVRD